MPIASPKHPGSFQGHAEQTPPRAVTPQAAKHTLQPWEGSCRVRGFVRNSTASGRLVVGGSRANTALKIHPLIRATPRGRCLPQFVRIAEIGTNRHATMGCSRRGYRGCHRNSPLLAGEAAGAGWKLSGPDRRLDVEGSGRLEMRDSAPESVRASSFSLSATRFSSNWFFSRSFSLASRWARNSETSR